jgi:sporulation protein YlmC with PRC-barrel domain
MIDQPEVNLVYRILDDQLVDVDGRRCGRVDDLAFDGDLGEPPRLWAILSGSGAWHRRLPRPLRTLGARVFGSGTLGLDIAQIPWSQVEGIDAVITLRSKARELGLGRGDEPRSTAAENLPRS